MAADPIWFDPDLRSDDERYIYEERLGMLEIEGKPTLVEHEIAMNSVKQFREMQPIDKDTPLCAWPKPDEVENDWNKYKPGKPTNL